MATGDVLYIAMGVQKLNDEREHVVCCGVYRSEKEAHEALESRRPLIPVAKRNVVSVFEGVNIKINVFAI